MTASPAERLVRIARSLADRVDRLEFGSPVACVYNPLDYARRPHEAYLRRYGRSPVPTVLVGMNPGPFGMAQTGVPFGDVSMVRDWMDICERVDRPAREHPKRPILGFDCHRQEVSGSRLWGWARQRFGSAEAFFSRFFVWNYCPLCFVKDSGANLTPNNLPASLRSELYAACDEALAAMIDVCRPTRVVGIGGFAETRIRHAIDTGSVTVGRVLHPSPASPIANRGWSERAERELEELGAL